MKMTLINMTQKKFAEVTLENKAKLSFEHLKIEYCLYWNQDKWVGKIM